MKVVPSQIEFTLPSPKVGIESLPVVDPPWLPKVKTKISTIHDSGQVNIEIFISSYDKNMYSRDRKKRKLCNLVLWTTPL